MTAREQAAQAFETAIADASRVLEAIGDDPTLSTGAIERYARAVSDAALLRSRWERRGSPAMTTGSVGQAKTHPAIRAIQEAERAAADYAERLGLTPSARKALARRVGHPVGAGQSPDRRTVVRLVDRD